MNLETHGFVVVPEIFEKHGGVCLKLKSDP